MDFDKIQEFNDQQKLLADENAKTQDTAFALKTILDSQKEIKQAITSTLQGVVKFLNQYKPEVSVSNQQEFPSYDKVVSAVKEVVTEVKNSNKSLATVEQKEADYSSIIKSLDRVSVLIKDLPKQLPKAPTEIDVKNQVDYTDKFEELKSAIKPPIVNVPKQDIKIPDYSKELKQLADSVNKIKIPEVPKADTASIVKAIKDLQKFISGLSIPSGGGGGGSSSGGEVTQGTDPWVVSDRVLTTRIDEASSTVTYIGSAEPGTSEGASTWQIKKIDSSSGTAITFADGVATFTKEWDERTGYTYS